MGQLKSMEEIKSLRCGPGVWVPRSGPLPIPMGMERLVEKMKACGWAESLDHMIVNPEVGLAFPHWQAAIIACIEVASGA